MSAYDFDRTTAGSATDAARAEARARLDAAVARIRSVFAGMSVSSPEPACPHCYGRQELALLRTPDAPLPDDLMRQLFHESPGIVDDFDEVVRRLLPQFAAFLAEGRFSGMGYAQNGLSRVDRRSWPREQADAVEEFVAAWWLDFLRDDTSPYDVTDVLAVASDVTGTLTPLLAAWAGEPRGGRADELLVQYVEGRIDDLLQDDPTALSWWSDRPDLLAELQERLTGHGADRLTAYGADHDTVVKVLLLAVPYADRW